MKKQLIILLFFMVFSTALSQKTKYVYKTITKETQQPETYKGIQTYSYEIQNDNYLWPFYPTETYPSLTQAAGEMNITGLTKVDENADIRIAVGFLGGEPTITTQPIPKQPGKVKKYISLEGFLDIIVLNKNNEVILEYAKNDHTKPINYDPIKYPMKNKNEVSVTKARLVNQMAQNFFYKYGHILSGKVQLKLPFAQLKKAKKGHAVEFDKKNRLYISKMALQPSNKEFIKKAIDFWTKELDADFGKMKDKFKYRTLYTNLTTAYILNDQLNKAHESLKKLEKYTGLFSFPSGHKYAFQSLESTQKVMDHFKPYKIHEIHPTFVYYIKISGPGYYMKDKRGPNLFRQVKIGKKIVSVPENKNKKKYKKYGFKDIYIQRIIPDLGTKLIQIGDNDTQNYVDPVVYPHNSPLHDHKASVHSGIFLDNKPPIIFKYNHKILTPYVEKGKDQYEIYEPILSFKPKKHK